jgi:hypothetical protein
MGDRRLDFVNQNMDTIIWAAGILLALVVLLLVWKAFSPAMMGRRGQRLGVSEYYELDKTRRLVIVRRDNVEHLVLIGGQHDLVIESGITPVSTATAYMPGTAVGPVPAPHPQEPPVFAAPPAASVPPPARPPRPPVFGERRPPPLRPVDQQTPRRDDEP